MSPYRFATAHPEPRQLRVVRALLGALACPSGALSAWGMYRRLVQVLRTDIIVGSPTLTAGSTVSIDVIATGEVRNRVLLELVQGTHSARLIDTLSRLSAINTIDPR